MYGFGDDRNPANDSVNVMEEMLVEYIVDVVRFMLGGIVYATLIILLRAVSGVVGTWKEVKTVH